MHVAHLQHLPRLGPALTRHDRRCWVRVAFKRLSGVTGKLSDHSLTRSAVLRSSALALFAQQAALSAVTSVMASPNAAVKLRTGADIPAVGLGVFLVRPGQEAYNAVASALKVGYRHVDTARMYRNEADVGKAIKHSGLPRDSVFITSKLFNVDWGYKAATKAVNSSLANLGLSYLDLMLMHHPAEREGRHETWQALEDAQAQVYKA